MILFDPNDQTVAFFTLLVTVLLPVLVGLVTKASTSSAIKAVLLAVLSAATGIVSSLIEAEGFVDLYPLFLAAVSVFVVAVATHFGLWKPTGVSIGAQNMIVKDTSSTPGS